MQFNVGFVRHFTEKRPQFFLILLSCVFVIQNAVSQHKQGSMCRALEPRPPVRALQETNRPLRPALRWQPHRNTDRLSGPMSDGLPSSCRTSSDTRSSPPPRTRQQVLRHETVQHLALSDPASMNCLRWNSNGTSEANGYRGNCLSHCFPCLPTIPDKLRQLIPV